MLRQLLKVFLPALLLSPLLLQAAELQTDWITPVKGQKEATLGARVQSVETDESGESRVTISIPKISFEGNEDIQEVVVVGRGPDETEQPLDIPHEWVADYDNDYYGLILYLGKGEDIPLRLYLSSPD